MSMEQVEKHSEEYAEAHRTLADILIVLQANIEQAKRQAMPQIRKAVQELAGAQSRLTAAIEENETLFESPRTQVIHGIKVGFRKAKGKVEIDDEAAVIDRIRKLLPEDQVELLIRVKESVDKNAVADLTVADLKRLGIRVTSDEDVVFIKPTDSEVDKLVAAFLKDATPEIKQEAAA